MTNTDARTTCSSGGITPLTARPLSQQISLRYVLSTVLWSLLYAVLICALHLPINIHNMSSPLYHFTTPITIFAAGAAANDVIMFSIFQAVKKVPVETPAATNGTAAARS